MIGPHQTIRDLDDDDDGPRLLPRRARWVPVLTVMIGSLATTLPFVADWPMLPPFGLLLLLAWRLLRPEMWPAWIALPLGLFDDLFSGQPLGSAMALWTMVFVAFDMMDNRAVWRDYWMDWLAAAAAILFCLVGGVAFVAFTTGGGHLLAIVPQAVITILLFPAVMRLCAALDRWRLAR